MSVTAIEPTPETVLYVARNMRARDAQEIYATCWEETPEEVTRRVVAGGDFRFAFAVDGRPACVLGAAPIHPKVWAIWMFATPVWKRCAVTVTRHVRRVIIPSLLEVGAIRASAASHSKHDTAHRWMEGLGAVRESVMPNFGKDGSTFYNYVWTRESLGK